MKTNKSGWKRPLWMGSQFGSAASVASAALVAAALSMPGVSTAQHARHGEVGMGMGMGMMGNPERMGRMVDHLLDGLNATDAQRSQIKQIAQAAGVEMNAQRDGNRALRERAMQIFTAPTVDAAAAELVRQQMTAQHDQMSKRALQAMVEVSKVLTPEQRAKLGERARQRGDGMRDRQKRPQGEPPKS